MNLIQRAISKFVRVLAKALPANLAGVDNRGGWWPIIRESFAGAWQSNVEVDTTTVLAFSALYRCIVLISGDVGKMRLKLVRQIEDGVWEETHNPAFSPVLRKPNHFQTSIQFRESWIASKLIHGNAYILLQRDSRRVVVGMTALDPTRTRPLVAPNGDVYYELKVDDLAGVIGTTVVVPASEIIHDRMTPLFHPLVGVSPIRACGVAALQGLKIQDNQTLFFQNAAHPGGLLLAPGPISQTTADTLKTAWETNFGGENYGRVAVLGDNLKFEQMKPISNVDAQLIEQLRWTAENVCTAFGVPPWKVGVGPYPPYSSIQGLNVQYLTDCLQYHVETLEALMDQALGLVSEGTQELGIELEVDDLLRMDTATSVQSSKDAIGSASLTPNEARRKFFGLKPLPGGDTAYMQQQNWPLPQLANRPDQPPPLSPAEPVAPERSLTVLVRPELPEPKALPPEAVESIPLGEIPHSTRARFERLLETRAA